MLNHFYTKKYYRILRLDNFIRCLVHTKNKTVYKNLYVTLLIYYLFHGLADKKK